MVKHILEHIINRIGRFLLLTWFPVYDDQVKCKDDDEGDEGCCPVDEEHDGDTHDESDKAEPHIVVLKKNTQIEEKQHFGHIGSLNTVYIIIVYF